MVLVHGPDEGVGRTRAEQRGRRAGRQHLVHVLLVLPVLGAPVLEPHLDAGLVELGGSGELLAAVDVRVVALGEGRLELAQLLLGEGRPVSASGRCGAARLGLLLLLLLLLLLDGHGRVVAVVVADVEVVVLVVVVVQAGGRLAQRGRGRVVAERQRQQLVDILASWLVGRLGASLVQRGRLVVVVVAGVGRSSTWPAGALLGLLLAAVMRMLRLDGCRWRAACFWSVGGELRLLVGFRSV